MVLEKYLLTFDLTKFSIIKIPFWMDNYTYNPWFLPTWMEKNHIKKAHLLRVLGLIGKANLDIWLGQSKKQREDAAKGIKVVPPPIPLHHIATICNHYHIDIRNFFVMPGTNFADENGHDNDETPAASPLPVAATTPVGSPSGSGSPSGLSIDSMLRIIDNLQQQNQKLVNELVRLSEAHREPRQRQRPARYPSTHKKSSHPLIPTKIPP